MISRCLPSSGIIEQVSWENVCRLKDENERLKEMIAVLSNGQSPVTSATLIQVAHSKFGPGEVSEIHVVQQEQRVWTASSGDAHFGVNRFSIEGHKLRRMYVGSTLENCLGQLQGSCRPDIDDFLQMNNLDVE